MTRRLLSACVGAALVAVLSVPAYVAAAPPCREPDVGDFIESLATPPPAALFRLRLTPRRRVVDSLLFGIHPTLALLLTDKVLDAPCDHPQPAGDDVLSDVPRDSQGDDSQEEVEPRFHFGWEPSPSDEAWWKWFISHWTARQQPSPPAQNEGYIHPVATGMAFAYPAVQEEPASEDETPAPTIEVLPMPREESDLTCPYLRQQMIDRHACQLADPEIERDVLANLESLKKADNLLELAKELARDGFVAEAMVCCDLAAKLCPGSPCAERAGEIQDQLAQGIVPSAGGEESAEPQADEPTGPCSQWDSFWRELFESLGLPVKDSIFYSLTDPNARCVELRLTPEEQKQIEAEWERIWFTEMPSHLTPERVQIAPCPDDAEPGVEPMVCGLMKACHLLVNQGMHHQAAELARQAYALDPQRVMADPLIYKMHLLAQSTETSNGASEESEPPTCPYCPKIGKPIREIVPEKKESKDGPATLLVPPLPPIDYEVVPALDNVLTETEGSEEESEESTPESMQELIETMLDGSLHAPFAIGTNVDGGLRVFGDCSLGHNVYHLRYTHGCFAIWKTTDASKVKP